ncbi:Sporulation stage 0, Spo0E-like regulatory phosphatase [Paenibacillus curdlanolyticus YK9]|uniref:Sporulation stage 0, Spo0E-like regulatory phosphatase n=1 Tax=Paenibacillus curdlanolyticus YK9 TaxID=717606 RepID=E0ICF7_9BACL|nr:aspartyl-phosphate phosphatase Spo0E family protein [Paenibacillus curdlanolyticus]EFM09843.1 Sporulation stage 0, Spo0E-like regulatory phosphatase [Paenibacillus curdlanolyticus YK9]
MENQLLERVEKLRGIMVDAVLSRQTFQHREVLHLSQMLDTLIVQAQNEQHRTRVLMKASTEEG